MKLNAEIVLSLAAMLLMGSMAVAQIPVELFTGHKKATLDIMFFRYFKDKPVTSLSYCFSTETGQVWIIK
jgi:hypothetical protein